MLEFLINSFAGYPVQIPRTTVHLISISVSRKTNQKKVLILNVSASILFVPSYWRALSKF